MMNDDGIKVTVAGVKCKDVLVSNYSVNQFANR